MSDLAGQGWTFDGFDRARCRECSLEASAGRAPEPRGRSYPCYRCGVGPRTWEKFCAFCTVVIRAARGLSGQLDLFKEGAKGSP